MAFWLLFAAVAIIHAVASGVDRTQGTCMLQRATMSTKKMPNTDGKVQEAVSERAAVHGTEKDSPRPVLPKPLVLISDIASANESAGLGNTSVSVSRPRRASGMGHVIMGGYPGYEGELKVRGTVTVSAFADSLGEMMLQWNLDGADGLCVENASHPAKNACGIHIHEGMLCGKNDGLVGGHFYHKASSPGGDPWAHFTYTTTNSGRSEGASSLFIGLTLVDVMARSVVVHDHDGKRIACGVIHDQSGAASRSASALLLALFVALCGVAEAAGLCP